MFSSLSVLLRIFLSGFSLGSTLSMEQAKSGFACGICKEFVSVNGSMRFMTDYETNFKRAGKTIRKK